MNPVLLYTIIKNNKKILSEMSDEQLKEYEKELDSKLEEMYRVLKAIAILILIAFAIVLIIGLLFK